MRKKDLRRVQTELAKSRFVRFNQAHLANCRGGLQFVHCMGAFFPAQALHPFGNGAAGYERDFIALLAQICDLFSPVRQRMMVQPLSRIGNETAADFYDQSFS